MAPAMLLLAAASLASAPPPAETSRTAVAEARVSVRIISGVRLKLDGSANHDVPAAHEAVVHTDGKAHGARLIEFE
jgi:hypothetical protein